MVSVKSFRALIPSNESAKLVASVPYDVVNRDEARDLVGENKDSFLRVVRSDLDFENEISAYDDQVYARAKENLESLLVSGSLSPDAGEYYYIYRIEAGDHRQTGIIGLSSVDDYENSLVKIHEKTRPEKLEDRTRHMIELKAHTGPVLLTFRDNKSLAEIISATVENDPLFSFVADDGVSHTIWRASEVDLIENAFKEVSATYIADGHHRAESSKMCRDKFRSENTSHIGDEAYNYFLTVLFPESELNILAYNRVVKSFVHGLTAEKALEKIAQVMSVKKSEFKEPRAKGEFCMYLEGQWYSLSPKESCSTDPVESLDCSILQTLVLEPVFSIDDPRTNSNVAFVGGIRGAQELERLVDSGAAVVAFSLFPVTVADLLAVADTGNTMPPKSTWFEPKLRSGVATHQF